MARRKITLATIPTLTGEQYLCPESYIHHPRLDIADMDRRKSILEYMSSYQLTKMDCYSLKGIFNQEMKLGLSANENDRKSSCLLMENTFVNRLPSGKEDGHFLSLDLGSTNFRIIVSRLHGNHHLNDFTVKYYDVGSHLRKGPSSKPLFDHLAECIDDFIQTAGRGDLKIYGRMPLGFSFSYPMRWKAVDAGYLVTWTKSYDLPDAVGDDIVKLLREAIDRRGTNVDVVAIVNDSTGTLVKGHYLDNDCQIGMILGSGFNCCYVEAVDRIPKLTPSDKEQLKGRPEVAIDIECGGFGDNGCIDRFKTEVDFQVDQESLFPKSYSFEKMFSGNFLGDIARRIMIRLVEKKLLFDGKVTDQLKKKDSITAAELVYMERVGGEAIRKILDNLGYPEVTVDDVQIVSYVGRIVAIRGAHLASTLLSCLIDRIDRKRVVVAIDGSLYSYHPMMHKLMKDVIRELSPGRAFDIIEAKDGSGMGAGLAAACCG